MKNILKIFKPFEKINKLYLFSIITFWVILSLIVWSTAPALIPGPDKVFTKLFTFLGKFSFYEDLFASLILTFKAMLYSILIACLFAYLSVIPLFKPLANFLIKLRFVSLIGLLFTFTLILHSNSGEIKIGLLMFGIVPFFVLSLLSVIQKVENKEYELCKTLKYNRWQMLWELIIWGRMDSTIETIRANFAMAWLMITMVETFNMSDGGIGVQLFKENKYNNLDSVFALQIIIFFIGILADYALQQLIYFLYPHVKLEKKQ